jgi:hypothetical protein
MLVFAVNHRLMCSPNISDSLKLLQCKEYNLVRFSQHNYKGCLTFLAPQVCFSISLNIAQHHHVGGLDFSQMKEH